MIAKAFFHVCTGIFVPGGFNSDRKDKNIF